MRSIQSQTQRRFAMRLIFYALLGALIGFFAGTATVAAEWKSDIYVEGAGYVGFARTAGWNTPGYMNVWGQTSSSVVLFRNTAWVRIWHPGLPNDPNLLTAESSKVYKNSKGGVTDTIRSGLWGDFAVTQSNHRVRYQRGTTTYTSHPDNFASCAGKWYGNKTC